MSDSLNRKRYLDMSKGLGILMITYGHITSLGNPVDNWMSLFKISIFYIVAGFLLAVKNPFNSLSLWQYCKKLLKGIMIPYFAFSFIAIIFKMGLSFLTHKSIIKAFKDYFILTFTLRGISALWFLPTLVIGEIIFFIIMKTNKKPIIFLTFIWPVIIALLVQHYFPYLNNIFDGTTYKLIAYPILAISKGLVAVWFIQIGYVSYKFIIKIQKPLYNLIIGLGLSVFTVLISIVSPHIDFNNMVVGKNPSIFFLGGITGSIGAILLFKYLEQYFKLDLLNYFGKNSLILMATQRGMFIINLAVLGFSNLASVEKYVGKRYYLETIIILGLVLLMEYGITEFVNKKASFLLGKKKL